MKSASSSRWTCTSRTASSSECPWSLGSGSWHLVPAALGVIVSCPCRPAPSPGHPSGHASERPRAAVVSRTHCHGLPRAVGGARRVLSSLTHRGRCRRAPQSLCAQGPWPCGSNVCRLRAFPTLHSSGLRWRAMRGGKPQAPSERPGSRDLHEHPLPGSSIALRVTC